jgi:hypothetical protein
LEIRTALAKGSQSTTLYCPDSTSALKSGRDRTATTTLDAPDLRDVVDPEWDRRLDLRRPGSGAVLGRFDIRNCDCKRGGGGDCDYCSVGFRQTFV